MTQLRVRVGVGGPVFPLQLRRHGRGTEVLSAPAKRWDALTDRCSGRPTRCARGVPSVLRTPATAELRR